MSRFRGYRVLLKTSQYVRDFGQLHWRLHVLHTAFTVCSRLQSLQCRVHSAVRSRLLHSIQSTFDTTSHSAHRMFKAAFILHAVCSGLLHLVFTCSFCKIMFTLCNKILFLSVQLLELEVLSRARTPCATFVIAYCRFVIQHA